MKDKEKIRNFVEKVFTENRQRSSTEGYAAVEQLRKVLAYIDSLPEEQVSKDIEEESYHAAMRMLNNHDLILPSTTNAQLCTTYQNFYKEAANWQKEQMEKERLADCDTLTKEEYEMESEFVVQHFEKNNRIPTFYDAIEYGYRKAVEKACEWIKQQQDMLDDCFSDAGDFADLLKEAMAEEQYCSSGRTMTDKEKTPNNKMKYRKKPVEIEAVQWNGYNISEIQDFVGNACKIEYHTSQCSEFASVTSADIIIHTLEGDMHANVSDYIIKGVQGEFYPCKPDIFEQTYEKV